MTDKYICPSCASRKVSTFYTAKNVPVNNCLLLPTKQQAVEFPCGDIVLGFCSNCGFITNTAFDTSKVDYASVYEDQQCFSPTFNRFAHKLAAQLVEKYDLHNKHVLEIGCGKGDFLALLCEIGNNTGVGIDPAYIKGRSQSKAAESLTFIRDFYSEKYANQNGDFVCCRHTLEHIPNTREFMDVIRLSVDNNLDTTVFFEVPDVVRVLDEQAFWDIYYEHCSYFSLGSLARLFRICGFEVEELYKDFDDQYLLVAAKPVKHVSGKVLDSEDSVLELEKHMELFAEKYQKKLDSWRNLLKQKRSENKRVVVWGSGSKCVAFLTTLGIKDEIEYIVDINPYRHGKYIPGAAKQIMAPEFLKQYDPDLTIVMNPAYTTEIKQMLKEMNVKTEVIAV